MTDPTVDRSLSRPNIELRCWCGWDGVDADVDEWAVEPERDRVVRRCPSCGDSIPEWGTLQPIDGAIRISRGPLREALIEAGYVDGGPDST